MADKPAGFIALKSLTQGPPDPAAALAEIRKIYFSTTKKTIENDLAHAIELLKGLPDEDSRDKAGVFMEGLAEMRKEWAAADLKRTRGKKLGRGRTSKVEGRK